MAGLILFGAGILIGYPSRLFAVSSVLRLTAWVAAWALAGAVSHWAAVYWRESYWIYFAPIGADRTEHILARMAEGALTGLQAGLFLVAMVLAGMGISNQWLSSRRSDTRQPGPY